MPMPNFMYRCPHCSAENTVALERVNQPTACAVCELPFVPHAPSATLLQRDGEQWVPAPASAGVATPGAPSAGGNARDADEQTLATVNPAVFREHPVQTLLLTLLCLAGLTLAFQFIGHEDGNIGTTALAALGVVFAVASSAVLVVRFVASRFESLTVTTQRSIWARGIINRESSEVQHDDIRNIQVSQSLVQRLVGAGTVAISSAGQGDMEILIRGIPRPHKVVDTVRAYQRKLVKGD